MAHPAAIKRFGNREQKIALPRQVAMYLCRTLAGETLQQIADKFNKKDHTTVMAAAQNSGTYAVEPVGPASPRARAGAPHRMQTGPR